MKNLFKIENLFYLTVFSLPLYLVRFTISGIPTNFLEILAMMSMLFAFIHGKTFMLSNFKKIPGLLSLASFSLLMGIVISIAFSKNYLTGLGILKGWFLLPMVFGAAIYIISQTNKKIAENIIYSYFLSSALIGLISLFYKLTGRLTFDGRLTAFYLSPNHLAMYLAPAAIFGVYYAWHSFCAKKRSLFVNLILITLILVPLYFTYSYGAWVSLLAAILLTFIIFFLSKKNAWFLLMIFLLTTILFCLQLNSSKFVALKQFSARSSLASRIMIWKASALMIKKHPFVGIGPGNFQEEYLDLQPNFEPYLEWAVPQPHNLFLAFWLQAGLVGLISFTILVIFTLKTLYVNISNKKCASLKVALFAFFIYLFFHGLIDTLYWKNDLAFMFWIFIAISLIPVQKFKDRMQNENEHR